MNRDRAFDEMTFQAGNEEPVTIYKRRKMREAYGDILRFGPEPGTYYETAHGKTQVSFDYDPDVPGPVRVSIANQPFEYEDIVEFMSFFTMLTGWLGRRKQQGEDREKQPEQEPKVSQS